MSDSTKIALHVCFSLFVFVMWLSQDGATTLFVCGLAGLLTYGVLAITECFSSDDLITPLSYHFMWNTAVLGVAAVYFANRLAIPGSFGFGLFRYISAHDLATGYLICVVGSTIVHIMLRLTRAQPLEPKAPKRILHPIIGILLFAAGAVVIIAPRGIMALSGLPASIARESPLAILLAIAFGPRTRKHYWLKLFSGTGFLVAANLLAFFPFKGAVLQSLFPLMIAAWKKSRTMAICVTLLVPVFYLGFLAPFVTASRAHEKANPLERFSTVQSEEPVVKDKKANFDVFMVRIFDPIAAGYIYGQTRFYGFLWGESMKNLEYAVVPRFIWPKKPDMSDAKWFTAYLGFPHMNSYTAMTAAGEMYWNFSVLGLTFGMIPVALCLAIVWRAAELMGKGTFFGGFFYATAIINSANMGDAAGAFLMLFTLAVTLAPILLWPKLKEWTHWFFDPLMRPVQISDSPLPVSKETR
ncbi:MAG TPA: hypothetical protein VFP59_10895 [Candidatus Angelobacter sp.]|nr:hypothetical protein [Candidatus Angelobacter sp.]